MALNHKLFIQSILCCMLIDDVYHVYCLEIFVDHKCYFFGKGLVIDSCQTVKSGKAYKPGHFIISSA